jgi:alpha-glucosidase
MVECYSPLNYTMLYYGNTTHPGAHFPFNFLFINSFNKQSDANQVYDMIKSWMLNMPEGKWANWVVSILHVYRVSGRFFRRITRTRVLMQNAFYF